MPMDLRNHEGIFIGVQEAELDGMPDAARSMNWHHVSHLAVNASTAESVDSRRISLGDPEPGSRIARGLFGYAAVHAAHIVVSAHPSPVCQRTLNAITAGTRSSN